MTIGRMGPGKSVLGERLGGAALCILLAAGLSLYVRGVVDDALVGEAAVRLPLKLFVGLCPGFAVMGLGLLVAPRSVFESSARARATGQLTGARLLTPAR